MMCGDRGRADGMFQLLIGACCGERSELCGDKRGDRSLASNIAKQGERAAHGRPVAIRRQQLLSNVRMRQWIG
jgi:hypothetical protein